MNDMPLAQDVTGLVRETAVHRDVYTSPHVFDLEMKRLFRRTWVFVGHASQVPEIGDFFTTTVGTEPVVMVRHTDRSVRVLYNRCPHRGVKIAGETCGNTGRFFRCPYHAWSFRTDGSIAAIPVPDGYRDAPIAGTEAAEGMRPVGAVEIYRDFVFARLDEAGISFGDYFGDSLSTIDNMVDRSPVGKLEVAGGVLRYMHRCNWKMLVENLTDTMHPMVAHESSAGTAVDVWKQLGRPADAPRHPAVEIYAPFVSSYEFYQNMGIRTWANGHGHTGVSQSIHSNYSSISGYWEAMEAAYGAERAHAILGENRHNTVYFPNMTMKGPIQALRIFKPIAADRTMVESWTFRLVGAPDKLLERTVLYSRLINAPTSPVGHDDLEMYERAQEALHVDANPWVNMQRLYQPGELDHGTREWNGTTEAQMRNQYRAWRHFMTEAA
jgi:phenylpropionate dioxygenase-like ring-hydroxylating dioxygenase large terminal subunit